MDHGGSLSAVSECSIKNTVLTILYIKHCNKTNILFAYIMACCFISVQYFTMYIKYPIETAFREHMVKLWNSQKAASLDSFREARLDIYKEDINDYKLYCRLAKIRSAQL